MVFLADNRLASWNRACAIATHAGQRGPWSIRKRRDFREAPKGNTLAVRKEVCPCGIPDSHGKSWRLALRGGKSAASPGWTLEVVLSEVCWGVVLEEEPHISSKINELCRHPTNCWSRSRSWRETGECGARGPTLLGPFFLNDEMG